MRILHTMLCTGRRARTTSSNHSTDISRAF